MYSYCLMLRFVRELDSELMCVVVLLGSGLNKLVVDALELSSSSLCSPGRFKPLDSSSMVLMLSPFVSLVISSAVAV